MLEKLFLTEHDYRGLSISRVVRVRLRILAKFCLGWARSPIRRRKRLARLRAERATKSSCDALVLGLGGSASRVDAAKVTVLQSRREVEVFAINAFALSDLARALTPDHYVLTDPAYFGGDQTHYKSTSRATPAEVWTYLQERPSITIYIPHDQVAPPEIAASRLRYTNALGLQGFSASTSPVRPRGYLAITAYTALAVAGWLGFKRIFIAGIENTQFRSMRLSARRRVALGASHMYTRDDGTANEIAIFADSGTAGFFEDVSRLFGDLRLFSSLPIFNLDAATLIDVFPVATDRSKYLLDA